MSFTPLPARGLYAITDARLLPDLQTLVAAVSSAIAGGARVVQFRDKSSDAAHRRRQAGALLACCRAGGVPLIINDDVELAAQVEADGVHVGADDAAAAQARRRLGRDAIIGVSCYGSLERARQAVTDGADYVAFGSFFPSTTKPEATTVAPRVLSAARQHLSCPLVAIGGITADNGPSLIAAGADMLAVVSAVFAHPTAARSAAAAFARLF